jgi:uncharacterized protein (DUF1015 family)
MADFRPFRGYRPKPEYVEKIASPPYDVVNSQEAAEMAAGNDLSFLHVVKPEIDLPEGTDIYATEVYEKGAENLRRLINTEALIRDIHPCFYVYQQKMGDHVQVGIMGAASVDEYEQDLIKKHELTRKEKEDDRTRHVDTLNANAGPVFLTYKGTSAIDGIVEDVRTFYEPLYAFDADDGIRHTLWAVSDPEKIDAIQAAFETVPCMYVADGHHRSASAVRTRALRRDRNKNHTGQEGYNFFMTVAFPGSQLKILDYNRVVKDLNDHSSDEFCALLTTRFEIAPADAPSPPQSKQFGMYLGGKWYRLKAKPGTYSEDDPVESLDVSILSNNALDAILGIKDLRTDNRVNFVGGIRGTLELEKLVDSGEYAVAFAMHPTTVEQLMAIADAGKIMPPKSTWFEPKLRSGVVVRTLDE